tara:strand:+ start:43 stop:690 length:648 start_codon:yes stop_codon:yes gene_type:complete
MKMGSRTPPNLGWIETKLDQEQIDYLWKRIKERKTDSFKGQLAGNITGSYEIEDKDDYFFKEVLNEHVSAYYNMNGNKHPIPSYIMGEFEFWLQSFWVNYQNQGEFNPFHNHGGVYSFVTWLKIPTCWEDQCKLSFLEGMQEHEKKASNFEFEYTDMLGRIKTYGYHLSPEWEGVMLFFPAALKHAVYPFYECDESRISISGNLFFRNKKLSDDI